MNVCVSYQNWYLPFGIFIAKWSNSVCKRGRRCFYASREVCISKKKLNFKTQGMEIKSWKLRLLNNNSINMSLSTVRPISGVSSHYFNVVLQEKMTSLNLITTSWESVWQISFLFALMTLERCDKKILHHFFITNKTI